MTAYSNYSNASMSSGTDAGLDLGGTSRSEIGDRPLTHTHRGHVTVSDPCMASLKRWPKQTNVRRGSCLTEPGLWRRTADQHA